MKYYIACLGIHEGYSDRYPISLPNLHIIEQCRMSPRTVIIGVKIFKDDAIKDYAPLHKPVKGFILDIGNNESIPKTNRGACLQ